MNKILLLVFCVSLAGFSYSAQSITDLNTNSPVPLGELLTITGTFNDTDSNSSVFCKFLTKQNGRIVERLTDERTFPNGDFYAQRRIKDESLYERDQLFVVSVSCETVTEDTNFTVGQRETVAHLVEQETLFAFQQGNLDVVFFFGAVFIVIMVIVIVLLFAVKGGGFNRG